MKRILPLALVSLAVLLGACGGGSSSGVLGQKTPTQVLESALSAAKKSGSVHFSLVGKASGKTERIVGDVSGTAGHETIIAGSVTIQAKVVAGGAYVEGNAGGLEAQMQLSPTVAATYAGKWISIAKTDSPYPGITKALVLAATLTELKLTGHLTLTTPTNRAAHTVIGVRGELPGSTKGTTASGTLYVSTAAPTVPYVFATSQTASGTTETEVGTYSNWGKPLHLVAPTGTVAFSSLPVASQPSS